LDDSTEERPVRYVWHPAIEALLWFLGWLVVAVSCGIIWGFLIPVIFPVLSDAGTA